MYEIGCSVCICACISSNSVSIVLSLLKRREERREQNENQTEPNQTKPNQTKPNQTKPNQTKPKTGALKIKIKCNPLYVMCVSNCHLDHFCYVEPHCLASPCLPLLYLVLICLVLSCFIPSYLVTLRACISKIHYPLT